MSISISRTIRRILLCSLISLINCCILTACLSDSWRPLTLEQLQSDGFRGRDATRGQHAPSKDGNLHPAGIDGKARDIERSLGVQ